MLTRFLNGLNFFGMLSHVFLPMMTTFERPSGALDVTCEKYAISFGSRHGRRAFCPIPFDLVAATMRVSRDISSQ